MPHHRLTSSVYETSPSNCIDPIATCPSARNLTQFFGHPRAILQRPKGMVQPQCCPMCFGCSAVVRDNNRRLLHEPSWKPANLQMRSGKQQRHAKTNFQWGPSFAGHSCGNRSHVNTGFTQTEYPKRHRSLQVHCIVPP